MELKNLKIKYNKLLKREKNAENYLNNVASEKEAEKWTPLFMLITQKLSMMMIDFEKVTGREMTDDEISNGFKDVNI